MPDDAHDDPRLALRRHTDRCFFRVEEVVPGPLGGYIVDGILIPREEVAELIGLDHAGAPLPACAPATSEINNQKSEIQP